MRLGPSCHILLVIIFNICVWLVKFFWKWYAVYLNELQSKASLTTYVPSAWGILISKSLNNIHAIRNCKGNGHPYYLNCCVFLCYASVGVLNATQELQLRNPLLSVTLIAIIIGIICIFMKTLFCLQASMTMFCVLKIILKYTQKLFVFSRMALNLQANTNYLEPKEIKKS